MREQQRHRSTIFRKIFSRFVLAGLLPVLAMGGTGIALLYISLSQSNADLEGTVMAQKQVEIERFFNDYFESLNVSILDAGNGNPLPDSGQADFLQTLLAFYPEFRELSIISSLSPDRGKETARFGQGGGKFEPLALRPRQDDPAFQRAAEGKQYIGPVEWDGTTPHITLAAPLVYQDSSDVNKSSAIVGVIAGDLRLTKLEAFFLDGGFGGTGSVYLIDENGNILGYSQGTSRIGTNVSGLTPSIDAAHMRRGITNTQVFSAALSLRQVHWRLVAEWPVGDAFSDLRNLAALIVLLALLLIGALVVLANRQSHEIAGPIRVLEAVAVRIGRGDFHVAHAVHTGDEIESLSDAIVRMTRDLAKLQQVRAAQIRAQAFAGAMAKEQQLSEAKDFLLATASHQFRTPISALSWSAGILKRMALPEDAKKLLEGVEVHAVNLATIVSDLLNATAFGPGYILEEQPAVLSLRDAVKAAVERFRPEAEKKGVRLVWEAGANDPLFVAGNTLGLKLVTEHVIANAVTYTTQGEVRVSVSRTSNQAAQFSVQDTGIGIPKSEQPYLFSSFFRASNAIEAKNVGTGLGLFIVHNIVVGYGGNVSVASEQGKGTLCTVVLPKASSEALTAVRVPDTLSEKPETGRQPA